MTGKKIAEALLGSAKSDTAVAEFLSRQYGVPAVDLDKVHFEDGVQKWLPRDLAEKYLAVPIRREGDALIIAMADPGNIYAQDDLKFVIGMRLEIVVASESSIRTAILKYPPSQPVG